MIERLKADPERWYRENKLETPAWLQAAKQAAPEHNESRAGHGHAAMREHA
jgi:hypothetical protein